MDTSFDTCLAFTRSEEGSYVNDPRDSGNWTSGQVGKGNLVGSNMGVGAPALLEWMGKGATLTAEQMHALPLSTYEAIARCKYWTPLGCEVMPSGLDVMAFDFGWNRGVWTSLTLFTHCLSSDSHRSALADGTSIMAALDAIEPEVLLRRISPHGIEWLQQTMNIQVDGIVGPQTVRALDRNEDLRLSALILVLSTAQIASYRSLSNFSIYGGGWLARTARRQSAALALAGRSLAAQYEATA